MKLSEIVTHFVAEDEDGPKVGESDGKGLVEVAEVVKDRKPEIAKKYLRAMWGKHRLAYHEMPFFGSGDTAYDKIDAAVKEAIANGLEVEMSIPVQGTDDLDMDELNYQATIADSQEVYLGYDPKDDTLYVGVDAWLREEDFNEAWDREFENATGQAFDDEDDEHQKVFNSAWKEYRDSGFVGILFKLSHDLDDADDEITMPGGFYKGIYRGELKRMSLIDLRLD
jgi:hypothetical protein